MTDTELHLFTAHGLALAEGTHRPPETPEEAAEDAAAFETMHGEAHRYGTFRTGYRHDHERERGRER